MEINFNKLKEILHSKTNSAINKLEEFKCTTPEYKNILASILNNLEALKKLQEHDTFCADCIEKVIEKAVEKPAESQPVEATSGAIGKEWIPFKEGKK